MAAEKISVGNEIRRWRHKRQLTLAQIAQGSGLNVGYLSQIENCKAVPSLEALMGIARALDVPAAWLLVDATPPPRVVRAAERPVIADSKGGKATEVDGGTARDIRVIETIVPVGGRTGVHAHTGDEHHYVLSGRFRMTQGEHVIEVGPGDYLAWDPTVPHDVENIGDEPGTLLLIYPRHGRRSDAP